MKGVGRGLEPHKAQPGTWAAVLVLTGRWQCWATKRSCPRRASLCLGCRPAPTWNPGWVRLCCPHQPPGVTQACWCHPGSHASSLSCSQTRVIQRWGVGGGNTSISPQGHLCQPSVFRTSELTQPGAPVLSEGRYPDPTPEYWQGTGRTEVLLGPTEGSPSPPGSPSQASAPRGFT